MNELKKVIDDYLSGKIGAKEFETIYIDSFRSRPSSFFGNLDENSNWALCRIFSAVDRFYDGDDPDEIDIGESELYSEVMKWRKKLA